MAKFNCNFISYTFSRTVDITVVVPSVTIPQSMGMGLAEGARPMHSKEDKYPVLYLLHGYGNNHATWSGYTNIELFAEERNIAVVMISAENKFYINHGTDRFYDFIENELPDFVCGMFPVSRKPEDTYIAGLSMGGYGTLSHALSNPEKYAALGAFSAAVSLEGEMMESLSAGGEVIDPVAAAKNSIGAGKRLPKMYIACGRKDFLIEANEKFRDELKSLGADVTWDEHPDYGHEWRFWNIQVEKFLDWIERTDAYGKQGKRQI